MLIPSRREKRYETLRVSDFMSCADRGEHDCVGAGDPSHGRRVLLRKLCPLCGSICGVNSWPYGITVQLVPESKFDLASHGPRAVSARAAETCADKSAASGGDSVAHRAQERAGLNRKLFPHPRAHFQIQTDVQTEPSDQKSAWAEHRVLSFGSFAVKQFLILHS